MTPGGMVRKCPKCERPISAAASSGAQVDVAAMFGAVANASLLPKVQRVVEMPAATPVADDAGERTADSYLAGMRSRLGLVKARLAEMAKWQREEALLERMIAAADPLAN